MGRTGTGLLFWGRANGRTVVKSQTLLFSQLPSLLSSRVEKFSVRKYDENGEKQRKGMVSVLEILREKLVPSPYTFHCVL